MKRAAQLSGSKRQISLFLEFSECVSLLVSAVRAVILCISELRIPFSLLELDVLASACRALSIVFDTCPAGDFTELIYFDIILFHCFILLLSGSPCCLPCYIQLYIRNGDLFKFSNISEYTRLCQPYQARPSISPMTRTTTAAVHARKHCHRTTYTAHLPPISLFTEATAATQGV